MLTPGEKFGDYQILKCLSYDLMGSFYRVRKAREREERTMFILPPLVSHDVQYKERFDAACRTLKKVEHGNIFSVRDAQVIKQRYTLFSDDFEGQNIADYAEQQARKRAQEQSAAESDELLADQPVGMDANEVKEIIRALAEALRTAHEHSITHLNLNPTNILRSNEGEIKVIGLGLMQMAGKSLFEKLVSAGIPPISLGARRIRINTVDVLSPEVRLGKEGDHRSDIYALGLTAYWLLTGLKPQFDYQPPSAYVKDLEPGWDMVVARCLERDPEKRYQSAAAVIRDLDRLSQLHLNTVPEEAGTKETKNILRHIDFIPVPKSIEKRGMAMARTFRLGVIGICGLVLTFIAVSFYTLAFSEDGVGDGPVAVRTPEGKSPRLMINVTPQNASIRFPAENLNFIVRDGRLKLNILPGTYRMEVISPQYKKAKKLVEVTREPQSLNFELKADWATVEIETTPGATAQAIDQKGNIHNLGQADAGGKLLVAETLYTGKYTLRLSKPDFRSFEMVDFEVGGGEVKKASFPLEPLPGTLRVRSEPRDADIIIDGQVIGQTNMTVEELPVMEPFQVTLRKPGYRDKTLALKLEPNTRTVLDFEQLTRQSGALNPVLKFNGKEATEAELEETQIIIQSKSPWWDTKQVFSGAMAENGILMLKDIPVGEITMRIIHPDFTTVERQFDLPDKGFFKLPLNLVPKPATINIVSHPKGLPLTMTVNGRSRELGSQTTFAVKPYTAYELTLQAPDYQPLSRKIELKPDERFTWDATLQRIPAPEKGQPYTVPYQDIAMVWVPAGSFSMGSPLREPSRLPEEGPETTVTISQPFWMGTHEITQEQYLSVMGSNPSNFQGKDKPVESVGWREAMEFAKKINQREKAGGRLPSGYQYRLPTEAEWEYAARAGSSTPFHWGSTASPARGNFKGEYPRDFSSNELDDGDVYGTLPAGNFEPNKWGLYDMHGNVREWCLDYFNARLPGGSHSDWVQTDRNSRRVIRGGGWEDFAIHSRAASRGQGQRETTKSAATGFRLVLGPDVKM